MKANKFFSFCAAVAIAICFTVGASAQVLTLNLQDSLCWTNVADAACCENCVIGDSTVLIQPGGYWDQTYNDNDTTICFGEFVFSHLTAGPGASWGKTYWDGFTYVINGDSCDYGPACDGIKPCGTDWVTHQWGCMAGGGLDDRYNVSAEAPYLLAYWGYHMEPEYYDQMHIPGTPPPAPMHCLTVHLKDYSLFDPQEVWICNSPWPYYGNICGDGIAHPFNKKGDHFFLYIKALDEDGEELFSRTDTLAYYDTTLWQPAGWHRVDLSEQSDVVRELYFTMESSDADPQWGPNTAVYFCLDKLKVIKQKGIVSPNQVTQKVKASTVKSSAKGLMEVTDYFPITSYTGGEVLVYDINGKEVLKTTVKANEKPNLSKLPKGEYRLRHGHRFIPFKKIK
jgi:hypothetical protein